MTRPSAAAISRRGPRPLWVDPVRHAAERARFERFVVAGPQAGDCAIWCGAIGGDGYGRFWVRRDGVAFVVRAHRYALAVALGGRELAGAELALHECDNPACVRVVEDDADPERVGGPLHVVTGTQAQNMARMGRRGRGGGRPLIAVGRHSAAARRARSVALRDAVRNGWDAEAVAAALLGSGELTLW